MLSHSSLSVKNFFHIFFDFFQSRKRRRRDLNPRAAINDLLPFQGSPFGQLGYFSKLPYLILVVFFFLRSNSEINHNILFLICQVLFLIFFNRCIWQSGESGIRTHAPLRTNGFQDRLVMTTSISLQIRFCHQWTVSSIYRGSNASYILTLFFSCVNIYFLFSSVFIWTIFDNVLIYHKWKCPNKV